METYTVAACQVNCGPDSEPAGNASKIIACLRQAAAAGARLALFPELSLSGYTTDEQDIRAKAAATTPAIVSSVCQAAQGLNIAAVVGIYEPAPMPGKFYNASLAIAPDGTQTRYRKIHICPNEPFWPSDAGPIVADLGFVRLGLSVCYDNWYPETTRMAFLNGAHMLHVPFYWPAEWERRDDLPRKRVTGDDAAVLAARRERMLKVFPGRALDNSLYLVLVDHAGRSDDLRQHLPGKSMVFDPYGELLAESQGWEEETLFFEYAPSRVNEWRDNEFFPGNHLRPDIYGRAYARIRPPIER
jgi:N-carbamoylputrescine amidase